MATTDIYICMIIMVIVTHTRIRIYSNDHHDHCMLYIIACLYKCIMCSIAI